MLLGADVPRLAPSLRHGVACCCSQMLRSLQGRLRPHDYDDDDDDHYYSYHYH